jgi:hypothetical protein
MNGNLFEVLVDRNIITEDTEIEATGRRRDLSGVAHIVMSNTFYYVAHSLDDNGSGNVIVIDTRDGAVSTIAMSDITTVDGMEPRRLASIYALNDEGLPMRQGARRGRKPKVREAA